MSFAAGLTSIGPDDPSWLSEQATSEGLDVFFISTPTGSDTSEFFGSVRSGLPLDPPLMSDHWDAFIDSLDGGLADVKSSGVVIIWADARNLQLASPIDFRVAMACLARVVEHVANPDWTDHPKVLSLFVNVDEVDHSTGRTLHTV